MISAAPEVDITSPLIIFKLVEDKQYGSINLTPTAKQNKTRKSYEATFRCTGIHGSINVEMPKKVSNEVIR